MHITYFISKIKTGIIYWYWISIVQPHENDLRNYSGRYENATISLGRRNIFNIVFITSKIETYRNHTIFSFYFIATRIVACRYVFMYRWWLRAKCIARSAHDAPTCTRARLRTCVTARPRRLRAYLITRNDSMHPNAFCRSFSSSIRLDWAYNAF